MILHHLDAIDNILYAEGGRYKLFFEEEENHESIKSEINRHNQELAEKTKEIKKLKEEKERLEGIANKIVDRILTSKPAGKPKRIRANSL